MESTIFDKKFSDLQYIINTYKTVDNNNKIQLGEVFTPVNLIVEMINHFPKSLWKNPNLKCL